MKAKQLIWNRVARNAFFKVLDQRVRTFQFQDQRRTDRVASFGVGLKSISRLIPFYFRHINIIAPHRLRHLRWIRDVERWLGSFEGHAMLQISTVRHFRSGALRITRLCKRRGLRRTLHRSRMLEFSVRILHRHIIGLRDAVNSGRYQGIFQFTISLILVLGIFRIDAFGVRELFPVA